MKKLGYMDIAVDVRGLNYSLRTGVNTYTLHMLFELWKLKQQNPLLRIFAIGLKEDADERLKRMYPFWSKLWDVRISLQEYMNWPSWFQNSKLQNVYLALLIWFGYSITQNRLRSFDYLILPQPKPLQWSLQTRTILVIHDLFAVIDGKGIAWFERLRENKKVYRNLALASNDIWVNSISTGHDTENFLNMPSDHTQKIKLTYLALPRWTELTQVKSFDTESHTVTEVVEQKPDNSNENDISNLRYILAVSGIEPRKNWHHLIQAFQLMCFEHPDLEVSLVLAGSLVSKSHLSFLKSLVRPEYFTRIIWIMEPSESYKKKLISNSLFLAYPSYYEGFGFPILEAFELGKCVITSKISSMPELAQNAAVYVNPFDVRDIASGLYILTIDDLFRQSLEKNIIPPHDTFSWDELGIALQQLIIP